MADVLHCMLSLGQGNPVSEKQAMFPPFAGHLDAWIRALQRNRNNPIHIYHLYKEICFKELAYLIVRGGKSEIYANRLEAQGGFLCQS